MYINELSCLNLQGQIDATMSPEYAGEDGLPVQLVDDNAREQVHNDDDLQLLEKLCLSNDNDNDNVVPPLEHGIENMDLRDSDDETYDPTKLDHDEYSKTCKICNSYDVYCIVVLFYL
jgi:hypothetical protein